MQSSTAKQSTMKNEDLHVPVKFAPESQPENLRHLILLLTIVFVSRFLFMVTIRWTSGASGFFSPDTTSYLGPAQSLLHGSFTIQGAPELFRTPGYPLFLVPGVAIQHFIIVSLLENLLLAVASAWLVWRIAGDLTPSSQAAFWAVLLYCFEPVGFLYSEKLLSETLFCTQVLLSMWLLIRFLKEPTYQMPMLSAVALASTAYTRPVTVYLGIWLLPVFVVLPRSSTWTGRLSRAILFSLVFALTLTPWVIRNWVTAGYPGFSSNSDFTLYFFSAAAV